MQKNEKKSAIPNELLTFAVAGKEVRVVIIENRDIWLVASDVAEALAYQDASKILATLNSKNIRPNQQIFDAQGKPITVTLIDVMGCGVLVSGADRKAVPPFHEWVCNVLVRGTLDDLRAKAIPVTKQSPKQEAGFQTFVFEGNADIRAFLDEKGEPWFVAMDIAKTLGYSDAQAMTRHIDAEEKQNRQIVGFGNRGVTLISEIGMHIAVSKSNKREAIRFQKWVTKSVLPEIRRAVIQISEQENETQDIGFQYFTFEDSDNIRVFLDENGNPWFVALDVCNVLGYSNQRDAIARHCEKDDVVKHDVIDKMGRKQLMTLINEGNLYRLIINSNMPSARKFEKWVFNEVLPTIRKTGEYELPTVGKDNSTNSPTEAEINPALLDLLMQKLTDIIRIEQESTQQEVGAIRQELEGLKDAFQKYVSPAPTKPSYVYLAYNHNTGHYKPGKGDSPDGRAFVLELGGGEIEIVSRIWFPSSAIALAWERAFQKMFEKKAQGREWFALDERQVQFFKNIAEVVAFLYA